jgi:hypothetical protein
MPRLMSEERDDLDINETGFFDEFLSSAENNDMISPVPESPLLARAHRFGSLEPVNQQEDSTMITTIPVNDTDSSHNSSQENQSPTMAAMRNPILAATLSASRRGGGNKGKTRPVDRTGRKAQNEAIRGKRLPTIRAPARGKAKNTAAKTKAFNKAKKKASSTTTNKRKLKPGSKQQ